MRLQTLSVIMCLTKSIWSSMKQYLTSDQTAKLIELGFEKPKSITEIVTPELALLQRELIEEKKIYVCPCIISDYEDDYTPHTVYWSFIIINTQSGDSIYREYERIDDKRFDTYEQALEEALKYSLENLV